MSWFTKMLGVDKMVDKKISETIAGLTLPDLVQDPTLQEYRAQEYRTWASTDPQMLLNFYKLTNPPGVFHDRLQFWRWVGGRNVPKLHYPAPEALMNHMKALLFGGDVDIYLHKDGVSEAEIEAMNERVQRLFQDVKIEEILHKGSDIATYSGTLVPKITIDAAVHDKPIVELYPRERVEIKTKWGKPIEYIFKDTYWYKKTEYTLHTIFGKGYVKYELLNDKDKVVPLSTVSELADLKDYTYKGDFILTTHLKNRSTNSEFPDSPYGGSDFEGVVDTFHMIDEVYSSLLLYIRRSRPIQAITEDLLPVNASGSAAVVPPEYEFDTIKLRPQQDASGVQNKFYRSIPELNVQPYLDSILAMQKVVYQVVGMAYTTVGLEGVGANASGRSLEIREKSTVVVRNNKIKIWKGFIFEFVKRLLIMEDLLKEKKIITDYADWDVQTDFPEYNGQSYAELIEELAKAKQAGLATTAYAVDKLYRKEGLTEEQKLEMVRDLKIENAETILEDEFSEVE